MALLRDGQPESGWTKTELAQVSGVGGKGGIDEQVEGFLRLGFLKADGDRFRVVEPHPELLTAIAGLLAALDDVPDVAASVSPEAADPSRSTALGREPRDD